MTQFFMAADSDRKVHFDYMEYIKALIWQKKLSRIISTIGFCLI